jgi:signal recognition particle subunit SRP54
MKSSGGIASMMDKLPAQLTRGMPQMDGSQDKSLARVEGIINSMTPAERKNPDLLKASRKRRIAAGAGVQVQDVNRLLTQFEQMQKMMKMFSKGGMSRLKGMIPGIR